MFISETELQECVPVILDLDTVARTHICHKGVFFQYCLDWSWKFLNRLVHLEEICSLGFSNHPHCKWCAEQGWGTVVMLNVQQLSIFVVFSASGKFDLISSSFTR